MITKGGGQDYFSFLWSIYGHSHANSLEHPNPQFNISHKQNVADKNIFL